MFDRIIYDTLHWLMKWSGKINSWAWGRHVKILKKRRESWSKGYQKWKKSMKETRTPE